MILYNIKKKKNYMTHLFAFENVYVHPMGDLFR